MKKISAILAVLTLGLAFQAEAVSGDRESSAVSLSAGKSKEITLVKDPDGYVDGVYFLKITVRKNKSYTVWFEGGDAAGIGEAGLDIYAEEGSWDEDWGDDDWNFDFNDDFDDWGDDWGGGTWPPSADFDLCTRQGDKYASWMYAEDWESDDPSSWTYYIEVSGQVGQKTTVYFAEGLKNFMEATGLNPLPATSATDTALEFGSATEPIGFDTDHLERVFKINGRAGVTYKLATSLYGGSTTLPLTAEVFRLRGSRETEIALASDDIAPGKEISFTADVDDTYYIRLSTQAEHELEYPQFRVHALAYTADGQLGILSAVIKGPMSMRWTLDNEETEYESGDTITIAGTHTVKFSKSTTLNTPASQTIAVTPGRTPTVTYGMYTDKADHGDDVAKGAVSWSLKNTETSYERTLWEDDEADHFTFDGKDGYYYDFELSDVTGDAVFSITNATPYDGNAGIFALGETKVSKLALPKLKTKYILVVHHAEDTAVGGTYTISGFYANVGAIKFSKTDVKVKEDAASVKLTLNRTAKDGRVRVKYATVAGTAQPGKEYYAQSGIVEWANGDSKAKDIVIRLIPDLLPTYEGGDKKFAVKIEPIPEDEREEDEYEAVFTVDKEGATLNTATVTLTETTKASAGTVAVDCADPKKPVVDVKAGESFTVTLTRADAADFPIEVKLDASSCGADVQSVSWEKDDYEPKAVTFQVPAATDMKDTKKGTVKLTVTSKDKPKLTASSITVNIANDQFKQTVATWAKTLVKTDGVQVKEGSSGTWFYMGDDAEGRPQLKHIGKASKLTLTLTGPCKLRYWIDGAEQEPIDMMEGFVGKTKAWDLYAAAADEDVKVSYEYLYNNGDFETVLQTVKFGYDAPIADEDASGLKVASGKLPDGVKIEQNKVSTKNPDGDNMWYARGVPTKSGYYFYEIQNRDKKVIASKAVYVRAAGTAIGTFNGILSEDGSSLTNNFPSLASIQLTVTSAGKLTGKVTLAGTSYSFAGTGFDFVDDASSDVRQLSANIVLSKKIGTETYENTLTVTIPDAAESNLEVLGQGEAFAELTMAVPDTNNKGAQEDIFYQAALYRDNTKIADYVSAVAAFEGYYTAALPILNGGEEGKPRGNGYLTFTVDAKGKCKTAGKLVDDTAVSSSLVPALVGDLADPKSCTLVIPVFLAKKPAAFGGYVKIRLNEDGVPVVDSAECLRWVSDDAAKTYEGAEGWSYEIFPSGGWYDKVVNLQAYYLNFAQRIDMADIDEFPTEILAEDYLFETEMVPSTAPIAFEGNAFSVPKKSMIKSGKIYDLAGSVNPCNVQVKLARATGIVTGSFSLWSWSDDLSKQKEITGFKHTGILVFDRDPNSLLGEEVITAGYCSGKAKVGKRTWNYSLPFNIVGEDQGDVDWWEGDQGWNSEWGEQPTE